MKSNKNLKENTVIKIYITIKEKSNTSEKRQKSLNNKVTFKMDKDTRKKHVQRLCSICLNDKPQDSCYSCPICRDNYETSIHEDIANKHENGKSKLNPKSNDTKTVQTSTSQTEINHGLSLLKEVLSVFQNKRLIEENNNAIDNHLQKFKDASVNTEEKSSRSSTTLSISKIFHHSIESQSTADGYHGNFIILSSKQPELLLSSQYSINLSKQKSSSIPQMKLEELKHSLKEKTKSKDAIEEVNRMFATVKRYAEDGTDKINRPLIRNGPRVLPVVKAKHHYTDKKYHCPCEEKTDKDQFCQLKTNMCGGDSVNANKCCHKERDKSKPSVMVCCCYKNHACEFKDINVCRCSQKTAPAWNCDETAATNHHSAFNSFTEI